MPKIKNIPGICSFHPFFPQRHYPLVDIDGKNPPTKEDIIKQLYALKIRKPFMATIEETPRGWHVYIWKAYPIDKAEKIIKMFEGIDTKYAELGRKRGFWFLRTTQMFEPPVPVTYMAIRGGNWMKRKQSAKEGPKTP